MTDAKTMNMLLGGGVKAKKPRKPAKPRVAVGKMVCAWGEETGEVIKIEKNTVTILQDSGLTIERIKSSCVVI
jgi:hypothetical protein